MDIVGNLKFSLLESFKTPNADVLHLILSFARSLNHWLCARAYQRLPLNSSYTKFSF